MPEVIVTVEGQDEEQKLFSYYPDELSFHPSEFIGLTVEEAHPEDRVAGFLHGLIIPQIL